MAAPLLSGEQLLNSLRTIQRELSDEEIVAIVSYLDHEEPPQAVDAATGQLYQAVDFDIGAVDRPENLHLLEERNLAMEHFQPQVQQDAFALVRSNHRIEIGLRHSRPWIRIPGISRSFYHYQLYAAYWLMFSECTTARQGVIEGDLMGLGKTTITLLYIILNACVLENLRHIRDHPEKHLSPLEQEMASPFCPQRERFVVECACQRRSPIFHWARRPRPGASLVLVPASLISVWKSEWNKICVDNNIIKVGFYIEHADYPQDSLPKPSHAQIRLERPRQDFTVGPRKELSHRLIIVTSIQSYTTHVAHHFGNATTVSTPTGERWTDGLAWGRVVRDEAHLTPNLNTTLYTIFEGLVCNGDWAAPPAFVALTGTPMLRSGILDMLALVKMINLASKDIASDIRFREFLNHSELQSEAKALTRLTLKDARMRSKGLELSASDASTLLDLGEFFSRLLALYTIRRRTDSVQNFKCLVHIPPLKAYDIYCHVQDGSASARVRDIEGVLKRKLNKAWDAEMTQWRNGGGHDADFTPSEQVLLQNVWVARLLATAPGLARLGDRSMFTWKNIREQGWHKSPTTSPAYTQISMLVNSSGKLQCLRRFLTLLDGCKTCDGQPEPLVIISDIVYTCHLAQCLCRKLGYPVRWMHAGMNAVDRAQLVREFQGQGATTAGAGTPAPRILIGTSAILGQGHTLNRAIRVLLMEPSHHAAVEAQNADRVHRLGVQTNQCFFYRLVNSESKLEQALVYTQGAQCRTQRLIEALEEGLPDSPTDIDHQMVGAPVNADLDQLVAFVEDDPEPDQE